MIGCVLLFGGLNTIVSLKMHEPIFLGGEFLWGYLIEYINGGDDEILGYTICFDKYGLCDGP